METWWDTKSRLSIKQKVYLNKSPVDYVSRPISCRLTNKVKKEPQAEEMSKIWRWRCVFETFFCVWWSCCLSCLWRQWYVCKCPPDLNELIIRHSSGYRHCQSLKTPVKEPWSCGEYLGDFQMGKRETTFINTVRTVEEKRNSDAELFKVTVKRRWNQCLLCPCERGSHRGNDQNLLIVSQRKCNMN